MRSCRPSSFSRWRSRLVACSAALAQSAGDEQYVDPFQNPENDQGGNDGGGGGGSIGGGDDGGAGSARDAADGPSPRQATDTGRQRSTAEGSRRPPRQGDGATLPVTGLRPERPALLGLALLAMGLALRRRADFG